MKSFLYHILNNLIVDEYRKKKPTSLNQLLEKGFDQGTDDHERTVNVSDGKSATSHIRDLPKIYIEVMKMRFIQELSLKEMSVITGKSTNSLAVLVHRGIKKLKTLVERKSH